MVEKVDSLKSAQQASLNLQSSTVNYIASSYPISVIEILAHPTIFVTPFFPLTLHISLLFPNDRSTNDRSCHQGQRIIGIRFVACRVFLAPFSSRHNRVESTPSDVSCNFFSRERSDFRPFRRRNVTKIN